MFNEFNIKKSKLFILSLLDQVLIAGTMFVVNIVFARIHNKESYGNFVLAYSALIFLMGIQNAFILEPYSVFGSSKYNIVHDDYFSYMFRRQMKLNLIFIVLLLFILVLLNVFFPHLCDNSMYGLFLSISFILTGQFMRRKLYLLRKTDKAFMMSLIFFCTTLLMLGILLITNTFNGVMIFSAIGFAWLIAIAFIFRNEKSIFKSKNFIIQYPEYTKEHWNYSKWVLMTAFVFQATSQGYYWILTGILSSSEVGDYRSVQNIIAPIDQILISMSMVLLPILSFHHHDPYKFKSIMKMRLIITGTILISYGFVITIFGKYFLNFVYNGKYDQNYNIMLIICAAVGINAIGNIYNDGLKAKENPKLVFWGYIFGTITTVIVGIPLVKYYGVVGAAYGACCSAAAYSISLIYSFYSFKGVVK